MKTIIIISALIFLSFTGKSQTIDTATYKSSMSCKVVPFLNNPRVDLITVYRVCINEVTFTYVNGVGNANVNYTFRSITDEVLYVGTIKLDSVDYNAIRQGIKNGYAIVFSLLGVKLSIIYQ